MGHSARCNLICPGSAAPSLETLRSPLRDRIVDGVNQMGPGFEPCGVVFFSRSAYFEPAVLAFFAATGGGTVTPAASMTIF